MAVISAVIRGKSSGSLENFTPSIVVRRPLTTTFWFATRTKRFTSWKKSARLKKFPTNSSSSGTVSRPVELLGAAGVAGLVAPPPTARPPLPVEVDVVASTPDCAAASDCVDAVAAVWAVSLADSTALPGALWAGAPPASTGAEPSAGAAPSDGAVEAGAA